MKFFYIILSFFFIFSQVNGFVLSTESSLVLDLAFDDKLYDEGVNVWTVSENINVNNAGNFFLNSFNGSYKNREEVEIIRFFMYGGSPGNRISLNLNNDNQTYYDDEDYMIMKIEGYPDLKLRFGDAFHSSPNYDYFWINLDLSDYDSLMSGIESELIFVDKSVGSRVSFFVLNNGTRFAKIINSSITGTNFEVVNVPKNIRPGYSSEFSFNLGFSACEDSFSDNRFEVFYFKDDNNIDVLRSDVLTIDVSDALSVSNVLPTSSQTTSSGIPSLVFDISKGQRIVFSVRNEGDFSNLINFSNFGSNGYSFSLETDGVVFSEQDLVDNDFVIPPKSYKSFIVNLFSKTPSSGELLNLTITDLTCFSKISFVREIDFVNFAGVIFKYEVLSEGFGVVGLMVFFSFLAFFVFKFKNF